MFKKVLSNYLGIAAVIIFTPILLISIVLASAQFHAYGNGFLIIPLVILALPILIFLYPAYLILGKSVINFAEDYMWVLIGILLVSYFFIGKYMLIGISYLIQKMKKRK